MHRNRHEGDKYGKRRSDLRPKLVMAALCATLLVFLVFAWSLGNSGEESSQKVKSARELRAARISQQSEGDEFNVFRQSILKPFLITRVSDTEGNYLVQQHIKNQMKQLGWYVEEDSFVDSTPFGPKTFTNIIAIQNPSSVRRLTLACHHESKYFENFEFIGATDSAVPCALMIDIARHLNDAFSSSKLKDTSLQLIFFDGEEAFVDWTETDSLYGARHLAHKMETTRTDDGRSLLEMIDVLILLDLIGTKSTTFHNWFSNTDKVFKKFQKIEMRLAKDGLLEPSTTFQRQRSNRYFDGSGRYVGSGGVSDDHLPFIRRNVPVVHLISAPFPSEWHTAADNEAALDYPTINNIGKILRVFVAEYLQLTFE